MSRKVLVAVLDWGLGHATRIVPVIHSLMDRGIHPVLASSGQALEFLRREFPALEVRELPAYGVRYPLKGDLLLMVFAQTWQVLQGIRREHELVNRWCREEKFDLVISDHRYGCRCNKVRSVFIGHQLSIPVSGGWRIFRGIIDRIHWSMIRKFDAVWVPDHPDRRLSGDLSKGPFNKIVFIGPLSRFHGPRVTPSVRYMVMAIVSGPDPQRSAFATIVAAQLEALDAPCLLVTGEPGRATNVQVRGKLEIVPHLDSNPFADAICASRHVLSRSGYSSLMDYAVLGIRPWLVPTPGQPEQEYLARRLQSDGIAPYQDQDKFSVLRFMDRAEKWTGFPPEAPSGLLEAALDAEPGIGGCQVD